MAENIAVKTNSFTLDKALCSTAMQLVSRGEIALPADGEPLESLVSAKAAFTPGEAKADRGRVAFTGSLRVWGLYFGTNKQLYPYEYLLPVTDFAACDTAEEGMWAELSFCISSIDAGKINSGKIFFKIIIDVDITLGTTQSYSYVAALEPQSGLESSMERYKALNPRWCSLRLTEVTEVRDSLTLPMGKPNIERVLEACVSLSSGEQKISEGSLKLTGDINLSLLYKGQGESNPLELYEGTIPYKCQISNPEIKPYMLCLTDLTTESYKVDIAPDEDGEMRIIDLFAGLSLKLAAIDSAEIKALEDVYIINQSTSLTYESPVGTVVTGSNQSQCPVKEVITLSEGQPSILQIYQSRGNVCVDYVKVNKGSVDIEGVIDASLLYVTGSDTCPVYSLKAQLPFSCTLQSPGAEAGMDCTVRARPEHISANMLSDREVEIRCLISLCTLTAENRAYTIVTAVNTEPMGKDKLNSLAAITLYVVKKGDTLWHLAKAFNTTIEDIAALNSIENPDLIYPGQRLIIVKKV